MIHHLEPVLLLQRFTPERQLLIQLILLLQLRRLGQREFAPKPRSSRVPSRFVQFGTAVLVVQDIIEVYTANAERAGVDIRIVQLFRVAVGVVDFYCSAEVEGGICVDTVTALYTGSGLDAPLPSTLHH